MDPNESWIQKPFTAMVSDPSQSGGIITPDNWNFLSIGGLDLTSLRSHQFLLPDQHGTTEVYKIVFDHLMYSGFDVFCVQGISAEVLTDIRDVLQVLNPTWESACYTPHTLTYPMWMNHVIFYKQTLMTFVIGEISTISRDVYYRQMAGKFGFFLENKLIVEKPKDIYGFVGAFRMNASRLLVKILSISLPMPLHDKLTDERAELFNNLALKKALLKLFYGSLPSEPNCCYFVVGSLYTNGDTLMLSSVHRTLTEGRIRMLVPTEAIEDIDNPDFSTIDLESLFYYDADFEIPLKYAGRTDFIYHSVRAVPHAVYKCNRDDAVYSIIRKFHDAARGACFLLLDP